MKSIVGGSAALAAIILAGYALFYSQPLLAESFSLQQDSIQQQKKQIAKQEETSAKTGQAVETKENVDTKIIENSATAEVYSATAYAFPGRTASGQRVARGLIAADTGVLPMGTRVRLEAGTWSGEYTVADRGGAIRGRRIDIWVPTTREAFSFGRRKVKLTVLSYGARRSKPKAKR